MDIVTDFRTLAVAVAGLIALVAAGIVVARRMRPPAPPPPPETVESAPDEADAEYLDSSHIFSGSVLRTVPPGAPNGRTAGAADDDAPDRGGHDAPARR
jgi:hypothetical protein